MSDNIKKTKTEKLENHRTIKNHSKVWQAWKSNPPAPSGPPGCEAMAYVCCFSNMRFCSCSTVLSVLGAQNTQNRPQPPLFPQPPVRSRRVSFHDSFCTSFVVPNLEPIWAYFGSQFRSKKHTESKSWFYTFYDRFFETLLIEIWVHVGLMLKRFELRARLSLIQQNYQQKP